VLWSTRYLSTLQQVQVPKYMSFRLVTTHVILITKAPFMFDIQAKSTNYSLQCNNPQSVLSQPHSSLSVSDLPVHAPTTSSDSISSPLSPVTIHNSLSLSLPAQCSRSTFFTNFYHHTLPSSLHRLYDWTVFSEHLRFFCFQFLHYSFCLVPCSRLSWLFVSFWAHINSVSYRNRQEVEVQLTTKINHCQSITAYLNLELF